MTPDRVSFEARLQKMANFNSLQPEQLLLKPRLLLKNGSGGLPTLVVVVVRVHPTPLGVFSPQILLGIPFDKHFAIILAASFSQLSPNFTLDCRKLSYIRRFRLVCTLVIAWYVRWDV